MPLCRTAVLPSAGPSFSARLEYNPATMAKAKRKKKTSSTRRVARRGPTGSAAKLPKEAVTLVVILRAKEGQQGLLEAELRALIGPTRREEGCLTYDLHHAIDTPGTFLLHEIWSTRDHHRLHMKTPHFLRWDARKDALLATREVSFWQQLA